MKSIIAALFGLFLSLVNALSITEPSAATGWVVNSTSNRVAWTSSQGDPSQFDIRLINSNSSILQGALAIASSVPVTNQSIIAVILALIPASGYTVIFTNQSQVNQTFASSQSFTILPAGSPQPTVPVSTTTSASSTSTTSASGSGSTSKANAGIQLKQNLGLIGAILGLGLTLIN